MFITTPLVNMFLKTRFILASNSKSRHTLLKNAGFDFVKTKPLCNEDLIKKKLIKKKINKKRVPLILAKEKALSISLKKQNDLVVGSDTIILFKNYQKDFTYRKLVWCWDW